MTGTTTVMRRALVAVLALAVPLGVAACSDDEDGGATTTTTTEQGAQDQADEPEDTDATTTTVSDADFSEQVAQARGALEAAGADLCKLVDTPTLSSVPTTSAQMREWVGLNRDLLEFAATALEGDDPESAAALRAAGTALVEHAEAAGYPADMLQNEAELPEELTGQAYADAALAMQQKVVADCPQQSPTTVPEG